MAESKMPHYGGQALIEGVLMRGRGYAVAAMRKPDGSIVNHHEKLSGIFASQWARLPFFRGLAILWDSMVLGMKYITLSANLQSEEEEKIEGVGLFFTLVVSITLAIGLFFILPTLIAELINRLASLSAFITNILEGIIRLFVLVGYIWLVGKAADIARVFAYHGAEHKTINAFEDGIDLTVENVLKYPLAHPRCGTSFLLTLVVLSILIFSILGPMPLGIRVISRILLIPFLSMISYEVIRWLGNHLENPFVHLITTPNLLLQRLTTREPDEKIVEVALTSFKLLIELEQS